MGFSSLRREWRWLCWASAAASICGVRGVLVWGFLELIGWREVGWFIGSCILSHLASYLS